MRKHLSRSPVVSACQGTPQAQETELSPLC